MVTREHESLSDRYGEHVVAFVDILGFSELVQKLDQAPELIDEIYTVLANPERFDVAGGFADYTLDRSANLTIASDSIILSISLDTWRARRRNEAWARVAVLESVFWLQRYLLARGILTRGGVAIGRLLHAGNVVFGPALVEAYRLESQLAIFPRVAVAARVLQFEAAAVPPEQQALSTRRDFVTRTDTDGVHFVDYLHVNAMAVEAQSELLELFRRVGSRISSAAQSARSDLRAYHKVCWLATYYNDAVNRLVNEGFTVLESIQPVYV